MKGDERMSVLGKIISKAAIIVDKIGGGLSQTSTEATADRTPFENMPALTRLLAAEGAVLLRNDGVLPFVNNEKLSVFGRCQKDWFFVGYGSGGDVNPPYTVDLIQGLADCESLQINDALAQIYHDWIVKNPPDEGFWGHWPRFHPEMPLTRAIVEKAAAESEAALVVIGRSSGEDRENTAEEGSWYLTDAEKTMLQYVTDSFEKTVVLLNIGSMIDLRWAAREYNNKLAVLCVWQGGMESGHAVADLLCGAVTPSGKLPDTAAKLEDYPSTARFGQKEYNYYAEDIFTGYRWFETFAPEKAVYPFGYGLSYTTFGLSDFTAEERENRIDFTCKVSNTGTQYSGKEVVQIYVQAPQCHLGKAKRVLCGFAKTDLLAPGASSCVQIEVPFDAFASFDDTGASGNKNAWVLEKGDYVFFAGSDVRSARAIHTLTLAQTLVLSQCEEAAAPQEAFLRTVAVETENGLIPAMQPTPLAATDRRQRILDRLPAAVAQTGDRGIPLTDVKNGTATLADFIAQLSADELEAISRGAYIMNSPLGANGNAGVLGGVLPSLREKGIVPLTCTDGPSGIRLNTVSTLLPIGTLLTSTWNVPLCTAVFEVEGREMQAKGSDIFLGPGMNIHRNPLCGRNFEYYSEDPLLTGKIGAAVVKGLQTHGFAACPKHFACNNQETNRNYNDSRLSQRALREIYLKGFEICVKEAKPKTIMTSYNKINGVWGHYHYDLCNTILREDWGFDGMVMTDWWMRSSKSPEFPNLRDNAYRVRAGVDVLMPGGNRVGMRKPDGTLLKTYGKENGITLGELQKTAEHVIKLCMEKI